MDKAAIRRRSMRAGVMFGVLWPVIMMVWNTWVVGLSVTPYMVALYVVAGLVVGGLFGAATYWQSLRTVKAGRGSELQTERTRTLSIPANPQTVFVTLRDALASHAEFTIEDADADFKTLQAYRRGSAAPVNRQRVQVLVKPDATGSSVRITSVSTVATVQFDAGHNEANVSRLAEVLLDAFGVESVLRREPVRSGSAMPPRAEEQADG